MVVDDGPEIDAHASSLGFLTAPAGGLARPAGRQGGFELAAFRAGPGARGDPPWEAFGSEFIVGPRLPWAGVPTEGASLNDHQKIYKWRLGARRQHARTIALGHGRIDHPIRESPRSGPSGGTSFSKEIRPRLGKKTEG